MTKVPGERGKIDGWTPTEWKSVEEEEEGRLEVEVWGSMAGGHCYQSW